MPDLLSTRQLAERLNVAPDTIRSWVRAGRIPEIRINSKVRRFDLSAVIDAIGARQSQRGVAHAG